MAHIAVDPIGLMKYRIIAHATEALDGRLNMEDWLQRPSPSFEGRTPFEVLTLADPDELQRLEDILTALDYGMHI